MSFLKGYHQVEVHINLNTKKGGEIIDLEVLRASRASRSDTHKGKKKKVKHQLC